ncbi:MAG: hypothetical protein ACXVPY_14815 [Bacteroidia bacterium]
MNKDLYDKYNKLTEIKKSELHFKFKDSPIGIRLIDFLEHCNNRNYKNTDAVSFIYKEEKEKTAYNVLENRYFKLRKKMYDELQDSSEIQSNQLLTEEQLILYRCKNITSANNKEGAYKELIELEKRCWSKNIFELLPDIIDQLIFCNQSFNRLDRNKPLFERLQKANELNYDITRCILVSRKIYEINFSKGISFAKRELAILKELAEKNKSYPRFLMCYHHVSLYYKLGSQDHQFYHQVVSRHLTKFKKLFAKNPDVPLISYKVNYISNQHFHFNQITMFYYFNRCEFNEAYESMKEVWDLVHSSDSILKVHKTQSLYYNLLTAQCMAGRYAEANETSDLFVAFLKENNQTDMLSFGYVQKARVISDSYPQTFKMDLGFLMDHVDEYIKRVRKADNVQASLDETLVLKMKLFVLTKEYEKAEKLMKDDLVKKHLTDLHAYDLINELIKILQKESSDKHSLLNELTKKVQLVRHKATTPGEFMNLNWLSNHINYLQKK